MRIALVLSVCLSLALAVPAAQASEAASGSAKYSEQRFSLLQIGTEFYTNATVTTKAADFIFLSHSGGLLSFKVSDLPMDLREKLGYELPKPKTNSVANWTKSQVARLDQEKLEQIEDTLAAQTPRLFNAEGKPNPIIIAAAIFIALFCHLFFSFCFMLICTKAGHEPGALVWIPIIQFFPLLRAAGMAPLWFVAFIVPLVNIIAHIVWSFKISEARSKTPLTAIMLILPFTYFFAVLYLAFSSAPQPKQQKEAKSGFKIMTLEAT